MLKQGGYYFKENDSLSAFKAINLTKTVEYQSDLDPNKGNDAATIFVIGALDSRTMSHIYDKNLESKFTKEGENVIKPNQLTSAYMMVRFGLKGLRNWKNDDDSVVLFKTERTNQFGKTYDLVLEDIISGFPNELIVELAEAIADVNNLSEQDVKN